MNNNQKQNNNQKPNNKKGTIRRLGTYLYRYKFLLVIAIILSLTSNLLFLVGPKLSGTAISYLEGGKGKVNFEKVFYYAGIMVITFIIAAILSYFLAILMIHISQKVVHQMRKDFFESMSRLPISYFDHHPPGEIVSRISYDIDTVNTSLSNDLVQILTSIITVVVSFGMMFSISPVLVLVFVITIPLSILITKFMTDHTRPLFRKRSKALGNLNGFVEEMISGQKTIKAYHVEEITIEKFDKKNEEAVEAYYKADYFGSMVGPSVNFINNLSLALITVFGALIYLGGNISLGNISSFVLYSRKFSGPINEAANIISEFQSALAAAERVFQVIDEAREAADLADAQELSDTQGDIKLENVSFGYTKDRTIISNLNLEAKPGSLVAIVGPTGAGKTTIINLLMRFYELDQGHIYVDGKDITSLTRKSLRKAYAMVLQDTWLFKGTIFDNIAYGKANATLEEVMEVAKKAKIHTYIESLPEGYQTIINEEGMNISKGQKQLLTIARAMLLDSKMLILDEATSNVDTRTEIQIQAAMRALMENKTCFVIAHRLSTIKNADVILVINNGNIVEQGTHETLLKRKGLYSRMYNSQFE